MGTSFLVNPPGPGPKQGGGARGAGGRVPGSSCTSGQEGGPGRASLGPWSSPTLHSEDKGPSFGWQALRFCFCFCPLPSWA